MAKKKKLTREDVLAVISDGKSSCPDCGAEWADPVDEKGKPIKNPANQVMLHADDCVRHG